MIKLSAALAIGVTIFMSVGVSHASETSKPIAQARQTQGLFHFMTKSPNGTIVRGYPVLDGLEFVRIDQPISRDVCGVMMVDARTSADFRKSVIWCEPAK
jgi:hypothetical protein